MAPFEDGFVGRLRERGYVGTGAAGQLALFAHLDRWLESHGLPVTDLSPPVLDRFLKARAAAGYVTKLTKHGLVPLLDYLEQLALYTRPVLPTTVVDEVLRQFHQHLLHERGVGEGTAGNYEAVARRFLATRREPLRENLAELNATEVVEFLLVRSHELGNAAMQNLVQGLRAFLKFLYLAGWTRSALASAVATVARRRRELPRALSEEHVERLLQGCDRSSPVGVRDFAILTLLARLGLRAGEVARLELDDFDWTAGEVRIRGKGRRVDKLPVPTDVGESVVEYLRVARPQCADRRLFISSWAPRRGLSRQAIGGLVRAASVRAGLQPHGPHCLRHTVATGLLRQGAPLVEIAQLLRHQSVQTTVIYAKVDRAALAGVAQPWPTVAP